MRNLEDPDVLSQALAEPTRRAILEQLRLGQKSVGELVNATDRKQPNVSNHLAKMRRQGLVRAERIGRQVYYSIATPFVDLLLRLHEVTADPLREPGAEADATPSGSTTHSGRGRSAAFDATREEATANGGEPSLQLSGSTLREWQQAYCHSILEGQEDRAVALVNAMLSRRLSLETIYIGVFQWSLNHIGELFLRGETDEAHEHLASATTERMMARVAQFYSPVTRDSHRALVACVAGNWHALGPRMLADGLRGLGWDALFLGANTPAQSILNLVPSVKPNLIVLSCAMPDHWEETKHLVAALDKLRKERPDIPFQVALGGHYIMENPDLLPHLPADFTANNLSQFLNEVRRRYYHNPTGTEANGSAPHGIPAHE